MYRLAKAITCHKTLCGNDFICVFVINRDFTAVAPIVDFKTAVGFFYANGMDSFKRICIVPKRKYTVFADGQHFKKSVTRERFKHGNAMSRKILIKDIYI